MSRTAGQSAVKVSAYQARERLQDERTGYHYNYRPKEREGIAAASDYIERAGAYAEGRRAALFVGLYAPSGAPDWCRGRENIETFWSRAELAERRQDAQIAERIIIALPHELSLQQNIWLLQDHVKEFTRQGRVVQIAIHEPEHSGPGAERNIHGHLLVSLRGVDEHGFKASKVADQQLRYLHRREYVQSLRAKWADATNRHLARHGHEARIDHRTLAEQGLDRTPTVHLGPGDSRRERQGERSAAGEVNREIAARNAGQEAGREIEQEPLAKRAPLPEPARAAEIVDLDAWRRELEQGSHASQKPTTANEVERASDAATMASLASDGRQSGRAREREAEVDPDAWRRELDQGPADEKVISELETAAGDPDAWRREIEQEAAPAPQHAEQPAQEAAWEPEAPARTNSAADAPPHGRGRQQDNDRGLFGRAGKMFRSAFEAALDWIAPPVVADPHQQPVQQAPPQQEHSAQPAAQKPLGLYERAALQRREQEEEQRQKDDFLRGRFQTERQAAWQERSQAEREVRAWFAAHAQDRRAFYEQRFNEVKNSDLHGTARHEAFERLREQQRTERAETFGLKQQRLAEVRQAHPVPEWGSWLQREAENGDKDAARVLEQHQKREAERGYTETKTPLYQHFEAEREAARLAQEAAEQEVRARFAAYAQDLRGYYGMRFVQEKHSGMPGPARHDALELVAAQRRGDVGKMIRLERQAIAEVHRAHPVPSWGEYLEREAAKGDQEAVRALERYKAKEAERNRDRGDDGRGIEP